MIENIVGLSTVSVLTFIYILLGGRIEFARVDQSMFALIGTMSCLESQSVFGKLCSGSENCIEKKKLLETINFLAMNNVVTSI